jgi:hypothetical protein
MSEAKFGENNPNFGKSFSTETKAKMNATRETAIFIYLQDGSLINNFSSAQQAGKYFNTNSKTILKYCSNGKLFKEQWIYLLKILLLVLARRFQRATISRYLKNGLLFQGKWILSSSKK